MIKYKLISPLRVLKNKNKYFILNLNNYRNAHFYTLNAAKSNYLAVMENQIARLPDLKKVHIHYRLYPGTKRKTDIDNVVSVHKKFFQDAIVALGKIEDDSYEYIVSSSEKFCSVDKENPRVEIIINKSIK